MPPFPGGYTYEFLAEANDQAILSTLTVDFALLSFYKAEDSMQDMDIAAGSGSRIPGALEHQ